MSFLTESDLRALTKRKQGKRQIAILKSLGIPHRVVDGKPVVTWEAVNGREKKAREPFNWEAMT